LEEEEEDGRRRRRRAEEDSTDLEPSFYKIAVFTSTSWSIKQFT
jgi:hypothetical protein